MKSLRLVILQQQDGTWYAGAHGTGICTGSYGWPSQRAAFDVAFRAATERLRSPSDGDLPHTLLQQETPQ